MASTSAAVGRVGTYSARMEQLSYSTANAGARVKFVC